MGKGSKQTTTQSSSSTSANPIAAAAYTDILGRAQNVAATPYQAYGGELVAPFNAQQNMGVGNINANAGFAQPFIQQGATYANEAAQPITSADINQYLNPYITSVIDPTKAQFANINEQQQNSLRGNQAIEGALGGNRAGVGAANLYAQQNLAQNPIIAGMYQTGYDKAMQAAVEEQQRRGMAAYSLGNLGVAGQSAGLQGAGAQFGVGTAEQQTQQQLDAARMQQYYMQQAYPFQTTGWEASIAGGLGPLYGTTTSGQSVTQAPQPSSFGQYAGLGLAAAGMFLRDGGKVRGFAAGGMPNIGVGAIPYEGVGGWVPHLGLAPGKMLTGPSPGAESRGGASGDSVDPFKQASGIMSLGDSLRGKLSGFGGASEMGSPGIDNPLPVIGGAGDMFVPTFMRNGGTVAGFADGGFLEPQKDDLGDRIATYLTGRTFAQRKFYNSTRSGLFNSATATDEGYPYGGLGESLKNRRLFNMMDAESISNAVPRRGYDDGGDVAGFSGSIVPPYDPDTGIYVPGQGGTSPTITPSAGFGDNGAAVPLPTARPSEASYPTGGLPEEKYRYTRDYLSSGSNPNVAAGVAANYNVENPQLDPLLPHDQGTGIGLAGWRNERKKELIDFAKSRSVPLSNETEMDFTLHDLQQNYPDLYQRMSRASPAEAARMFRTEYERPAGTTQGRPLGLGQAMTMAPRFASGDFTGTAGRAAPSDAVAGVGAAPDEEEADLPPGAQPTQQQEKGGLLSKLGINLSPETKQAMMAAGFGMMASRSPYPGAQIGEGGLVGMNQYQRSQQMNLQVKKLDEAAQIARERIAETALAHRETAADRALRSKEMQLRTDESIRRNKEVEAQRKVEADQRAQAHALALRTPVGTGLFDPKTNLEIKALPRMNKEGGIDLHPITQDEHGNITVSPNPLGSSPQSQAPKTAAPPIEQVAQNEEDGVLPKHAQLISSGPYDYTKDAPYIEKGMEVPEPANIGGRTGRSLKTDAENYLQTGKLPPVSARGQKNPMAKQEIDYRNAVRNYANVLAESRGISPEKTVEMWRTAPGMLRFILGADGRSTVALGTAVRHLDTLRDLARLWYSTNPSDIQALNHIKASLSRQFGDKSVTSLEAAASIVGPEIIKAIGIAGGGTVEDRQNAEKRFAPYLAPGQLYGNIGTMQALLGGQLIGKEQQASNAGVSKERFKDLVGDRAYEVLTNAAKQPAGKEASPEQGKVPQGSIPGTKGGKKVWKTPDGSFISRE